MFITVKDLKKKLGSADPDAIVVLQGCDHDFTPIVSARTQTGWLQSGKRKIDEDIGENPQNGSVLVNLFVVD